MCGIAGILHYRHFSAVDRGPLARMTEALRHRGPDDSGYYLSGGIGLGHRRLSIIDLSPSGRQPLANEDESIWVICNGEIYDFENLRHSLIAKGHHFRSGSDSEVLVHLYEDEGEAFAQKLRGMFAFALWDTKKKKLILGRDRLGKKPLFFFHDQDKIIFASELKAIETDTNLPLHLNEECLAHYLNLGFFPSPLTKYREVQKLPAAHVLVVENGQIRSQRYWQHPFPAIENTEPWDFKKAKEGLREKLREAVRIRMIADVPLGAFLSGGVDSSLLVALMTELSSKPVKTFNISFSEASFDESKYARQVAKALGTEHHEIPVNYRIEELIRKVLEHFDEPFADSSAIPQYLVSQAAREHVTVALSGDGADEIFAGYRRYLGRRIAEVYGRLCPLPARRIFRRVSRALVKEGDEYIGKSLPKLMLRFLNLEEHYQREPHNPCIPFFNPTQVSELLGPELFSRQNAASPISEFYQAERDRLAQMLFTDQQSYLVDDILVKIDRMSMFHALEVRSPFLDHLLVEWAAQLPLAFKLRGFCGKFILKKLAEDYVPKEVLYRRKQGFALPLGKWFRSELKNLLAEELLTGSGTLFNRQAVETIFQEHQSGKRDWSQQLWALLALKYTFKR